MASSNRSSQASRMLVRPDCVGAFEGRGWTSVESIMSASEVEVQRRLKSGDSGHVTLQVGTEQLRGCLKRYRVRSLRSWWRERGDRAARTPGLAEAGAAAWCAAAGIRVPSVLAAGAISAGGTWWQSDSFFLSEPQPGAVTANSFWYPSEQRLAPPDAFAADTHVRSAVARLVGQTLRQFHQAGLTHGNFYLEHVLVDPANLSMSGITDLQRVQRLKSPQRHWRAVTRDLAQFRRSAARYSLSTAERQEWSRGYLTDEVRTDGVGHADWLRLRTASALWRLKRLRRQMRKRSAGVA